ncbi:MAG: hypothetical protein EPN70_04070 [Paraburkholderia sp.]|uniref:hypothetical protein n=1 Tax=Paraburkholderia sp. TaxID=1926495 RepID=UPI001206CFBD|nr:hypothetical protein [Paraburkholderia sp.]TAM07012.1 MAG: hypothetical protein EPN70_04070 [Paraburkholderia sp.]
MIGRSADILSTEEDRWHVRKDGTCFFASGVLSRLDEPGVSGFAKIARDLSELSGYGDEGDVRRAESAGFNAHLKKPILLDDLLAVVSRLRH